MHISTEIIKEKEKKQMDKIEQLEESLDKSLEIYKMEMKSNIEAKKGQVLTADDMEDIARQTFYMMDDFKDQIIKYLKEIHSK